MNIAILSADIRHEQDVVFVRQRARQIAVLLGFEGPEQTRISTAVSEIGRNAFQYAKGGKVEFLIEGTAIPQQFVIRVSDSGPGIPHLQDVLDGQYHSPTGMGLGLVGTRRLMDHFDIVAPAGKGTTVTLKKVFSKKAPFLTAKEVGRIADELARQKPQTALEEVEQQNRELLRTLDELRKRQDELVRLNQELAETNRGVVALYAEVDDKATRLKQADEQKSHFLSHLSHEFRTPVLSTLSLAKLLLEKTDGDLAPEQERQVYLIRKSMEGLSELVNDLLDLAKVEAGKIDVRASEFRVADLFGSLRGMFRPLQATPAVALVFNDPTGLPPLRTDESKVSQILRNFISNALKFTERGEVRVSARLHPEREAILFAVADTGIGIVPADTPHIFQEFTQLDSPAQRRSKGTGLGLPLSKKLAELLGGTVAVESELGVGSTFYAVIPLVYQPPEIAPAAFPPRPEQDHTRHPVLVVEDSPDTILVYEEYLQGHGFQLHPAATLAEARACLKDLRPVAIILDILLPGGQDSWGFLAEIKADPATRDLPVLVATIVDNQQRSLALGADDHCVKPVERKWLLAKLKSYAARKPGDKVLVIDDDEASRYLLKESLADTRYTVVEAASGTEGLQRAAEIKPLVIFLDLVMPDLSGFQVLDQLKADSRTRDHPVIIYSSKYLSEQERARVAAGALAFLAKGMSREEMLAQVKEALLRIIDQGGRT